MTVAGDCVVRARGHQHSQVPGFIFPHPESHARTRSSSSLLGRQPAASHSLTTRCTRYGAREPILDPLPQTVPIDRIAERGKGGDAISDGERRRFRQRRHDLCGALADCHPIGDIDFSLKVEHFALCPPHASLAKVRLNSSTRIGCIARSQAPRTSDTVGSHFKRPANPVRGSVTRLIMSSGYSPNTRATAAAYTVGFSASPFR